MPAIPASYWLALFHRQLAELDRLKEEYLASLTDRCVVCGRPATTDYQDLEDSPSCGRVSCELRIQAAIDYHDDRG